MKVFKMLDTVHYWLEAEQAGVHLPAFLPSSLQRIATTDRDGVMSVNGHLSNLRVGIYRAGVSVKGSICSYALKSNLGTLTRQDIERSTEQLSDELGLPMSRANITRVDVAKSLLVSASPLAYLPYFGDSQHYKRLVQPQSLYYQSTQRQLHIYDKIAEAKRAGVVVPDVWKGKNVLRYELRFLGRLAQQFNQATVTAADLYKEDFYMNLVDRWVSEFQAIRKIRHIDFDFAAMRNVKGFEQQIFLLGIQALGGETAALDLIERANQRGVFENRTQRKRAKDLIKGLCQLPTLTVEPLLLEEVERKVKAVQQHYR